MKSAIFSLVGVLTSVLAQNDIGSQGYLNISTGAFNLELDIANQVSTGLNAMRGSNAGNSDFNFLLPTPGRTANGNYFLGDIQLRFRPQNSAVWTDVSSHYNRKRPVITPGTGQPGRGGVLTSADITSSLGDNLPIKVNRTWSQDRDSVVMTFNLTNVGQSVLQMGGVGMALPFANNWVGRDQYNTWERCAVSDPALSLDAGYVLTNRLTGRAPTLITAPVERTPLEQFRLNYNVENNYPAVWLDRVPVDFQYEGIFSWWMASKGLQETDQATSKSLGFDRGGESNVLTDFLLQPGQSRIVGLRFFTSTGPRTVEDRLSAFDRPTIVGVPGFTVSADDDVKLVVRSSSPPTITDISPAGITFNARSSVSTGLYSFSGKVNSGSYGQIRVTLRFDNGEVGTAHYYVFQSSSQQLDKLGQFRFANQFYNNATDFFKRGPGIITYDNKAKRQVLDDPRAWVAGLSDEAGSGAYVSAAAKQLLRPNRDEISKLEQFATRTLWGNLQVSVPGSSYGGVKKSLFYYDRSLEGRGLYQAGVDHSDSSRSWPQAEANKLSRSYNYPHAAVVYWTLYRLGRNNNGLTTIPWTWSLDRAYDTIIGMRDHAGIGGPGVEGYSQFGLMEGGYFEQILRDLEREGTTNATLAGRANTVRDFMRQRADIWKSETYPYASEFPWDNTAQEEVYLWSRYFRNDATALATIETLMAVMSSVPHWGYSGAGRDLWDFLYSAKNGAGARIERVLHHYKGAQSALPLITQFFAYPADTKMLRAAYGGIVGPLTSIGADGFGSTGFHTRPDYLAWDPLSGDNGVNIALHVLSTHAVATNDASLGGWVGFGASVTQSGSVVTIVPKDSGRMRVYIADNALHMELDAGKFSKVTYDTASGAVRITFDADDGFTPNARLRWYTAAQMARSGTYVVDGGYKVERECAVVPLSRGGTTTVGLGRQ
ncbi:Hypothetical protein D9617_47g010820 [Elsinoe fawcettii]|nr:Hypothetical protein D9617_47g010820 [Elsinoe fawcettii]